MNWRINFSRFLLRTGTFIQSLPVVVMRPDDLIEFSWQTYSRQQNFLPWAEDSYVDSGLTAHEKDLLNHLPINSGNLLLLGIGGGREAIPLLNLGFKVTGIDFVADLVKLSKANAQKRGYEIECECQEFTKLVIPDECYDVIWLSKSMYSSVPTRKHRVAMVKKIVAGLKPGGFFLCQFLLDPKIVQAKKANFLRKIIAYISLGNAKYEPGDILWLNVEFIHAFPSDANVMSELEEGGFSDMRYIHDDNNYYNSIICKKSGLI